MPEISVGKQNHLFCFVENFFNISIIALYNSFVKSLFMMSAVPSFLVQLMFEQKSGNLPIACLTHTFSVVTVETRHCLHGPKAVRILLTRFATTLSKTWHRVLRTLSLLFVSRWKCRILEVERNRNLKIPQDTITQLAPEVTLKFKNQENSTAQQVCKCELYDCTPIIL